MKLTIENVSYTYRSPTMSDFTALHDISLEIKDCEIVAVVGSAGSGKTTLIQHLNGLLKPSRGRVCYDDQDIHASKSLLSMIRKKVGLAFQFPEIQLFEETIYKDVAFGPQNLNLSEADIQKRVNESLALVGFDPEIIGNVSPFQLSGGEQRRVALAGILAMEPEVLALDEPTVGLDHRSILLIEDILAKFHGQGKTIVFISHDMDLVAKLAHRVVVLESGRLLFQGPRDELFSNTEILNQAGLALPRVCKEMLKFKNMGYPVRSNVFTIEEAKRDLERVIRSGFIPLPF